MPPLIAGPYRPPHCRVGGWLDDALLGRIEVGGWSTAPISWPLRKYRGLPSLLLTDELVRALRTESAMTIAAWWGVHHDAVRRWRRALNLPTDTEGKRQRHRADVAARRGRPAHPNTREALLRGARKPKSPAWRAKAKAWMDADRLDPSRVRWQLQDEAAAEGYTLHQLLGDAIDVPRRQKRQRPKGAPTPRALARVTPARFTPARVARMLRESAELEGYSLQDLFGPGVAITRSRKRKNAPTP